MELQPTTLISATFFTEVLVFATLASCNYRSKMLLEDQRYIHEDLERLEQGIADRMSEEPKHVGFDPCANICLVFCFSPRQPREFLID